MNPVEVHYDQNAEREWERLDRHRTEFAVSCRVLAEFLPHPPGRILDVGGGPGRYTIHLTRQGYQVQLIDLSRRSLDIAIEKSVDEGIYLPPPIQGNALSLPDRLPGVVEDYTGVFDAVLLMGPLYHLLDEHERLSAASEAYRVLRPGGLVFAAFLTRFAPLRDIAIHSPAWIRTNPERFMQLLETGQNPAHTASTFPDSFFAHPDDIEPFMATAGFRMDHLQGCEGLVAGHEDLVNSIDGELWADWVELNYRVGREPSMRGASDHLLYVGSKPVPPPHEE